MTITELLWLLCHSTWSAAVSEKDLWRHSFSTQQGDGMMRAITGQSFRWTVWYLWRISAPLMDMLPLLPSLLKQQRSELETLISTSVARNTIISNAGRAGLGQAAANPLQKPPSTVYMDTIIFWLWALGHAFNKASAVGRLVGVLGGLSASCVAFCLAGRNYLCDLIPAAVGCCRRKSFESSLHRNV